MVDGKTLSASLFKHFKDFSRGYAYGFGYGYNMGSYNANSAKEVNECHFDFYTIPFHNGFSIGVNNIYFSLNDDRAYGNYIADYVIWTED